jgi:signal transduction histidine kinase
MTGRATELGGTLRVDSAPGRGTAVHLVLPLVDQPSPESAVS